MPLMVTFFNVRQGVLRTRCSSAACATSSRSAPEEYEARYGIRFIGWFNVTEGSEWNNVIIFDLPNYAVLDELYRTRPRGGWATPWPSRSSTRSTRCSSASGWARTWCTSRDLAAAGGPPRAGGGGGARAARLHLRGHRAAPPLPRGQPRAAARDRPGHLVDDEQDFLRYHPVDQLWVTRLTYQDPADGEWYDQEQEVDTISELVELYNPADILPWLIEAARNPIDHLAPADELATEEAPPGEAEDDWQNELPAEQRETLAAQRLWQLADAYRSQLQEQQAALLREFVGNAEDALRLTGDLVLLDEPDDTLVLRGDGRFETTLNLADMPPRPVETIEAHREGLTVTDAKTVAEFYDPADVLQWVTESLSERYPAVDFSAVYD